jgi:predicted MPP superfamily phosphohydrolase
MTQALVLFGGLLVVGLAVYAFFIEPYRFQVSRVDIRFRDLPQSLDGLRICHLSDTHTSKYGRLEARLEKLLAGIEADLCVISGDLVRRRGGVAALARVLSAMNPRLGIFAVLGNGDCRVHLPMADLASMIEETGIRMLANTRLTLDVGASALHVIGVDDPYLRRDDLTAATSGLCGNGFKLLLAHGPDVLAKLRDGDADLVLAGHTHGGQIRFPVIGPLWLHCRHHFGISDGYFGPDALSGRVGASMDGIHLYVSRGLGTSGIPARFLCPPEIALVSLRREV